MRRPFVVLTSILFLGSAAFACRAESESLHKCEFSVKSRCASGRAEATFTGSELTRLYVDVFMCGLPGKPGYSCSVKYSRNDENSTWTESGGVVTIENGSPWNPSTPERIKVTVGKHVSIDLDELPSAGYCGAGAELPSAIVILENKSTCRVWLP